MIVDLHAHYPMHLMEESTLGRMKRFRRPPWVDWFRVLIMKVANLVGNYEQGRPAVTVANLRAGNVGVALSVLYSPFAEIDLAKRYGAPPTPDYVNDLTDQIQKVERDIASHHAGQAVVAHDQQELQAALSRHHLALVHAVEGGVHLGDTPETVRANVQALADRGIAYVTIAHLFWRRVATNVPALPFLADWLYRLLFPQPPEGLTELGEAAIRAMVDRHVLIDITHMSEAATDETFALLDGALDAERRVPVIASHAACQFGSLEYNISDRHIDAVAKRHGVIGLIACKHYMADGTTRPKPKSFDESMEVVCSHIDRIHGVTGSHAYAALGSDLDGFIKPTLPGLGSPAVFPAVEQRLALRYGASAAGQICSGNALRVLGYWGH